MFRLNSFIPLLSCLLFAHFLVLAEDQVIGYAPEEPLFVNQPYPRGLKEEELRSMLLTDPKLRIAYAFLVRSALGGSKIVDGRTPEMVAALNDLKRRGDSATPLLLDIMAKNHNTLYEHMIPLIISRIGTIKMEPYVNYLREMIKTRPDEISASANEAALTIFIEHGTEEDVKLVQDLAKKRPFLAPSVERSFQLQRWKHPAPSKPLGSITATSPSPVMQTQTAKKAPETKPSSTTPLSSITPSTEPASSTPWAVAAVSIVAGIGLLWLLLKKRM
jgi:hypothetical protein